MAPEQLTGGEEDFRTDVFALGVLLRELLGERPPRRARRLAAVAARASAPDPAARYRDAQTLCDALIAEGEALRLGPERARRALALAAVAAVATAVTLAVIRIFSPPARPDRVRVAVADVVNQTGEAALDGLSGMVTTALEPSHRIAVVPRARFNDLLAEARAEGAGLDAACRAARAAEADRLLVVTVSRTGTALAVTMRVLDEACENAFTMSGPASRVEEVPATLERLVKRARREIGDSAHEVAEPAAPLTDNLEAHRQYVLGEQCAARPIYGQECTEPFRAAIALAPSFAAAHYRLAEWDTFNGNRDEQRIALRAAMEHAPGAPEKERIWIEALAAYAEGRLADAVAAYQRAADRWPDDLHAPYQIGDLYRHDDDFERALPWFERCVDADPDHGWAMAHLVEALAATGRRDALAARVEAWKGSARPRTLHGLSLAYGWLGDVGAAVEAARRGAAAGGGHTAQQDLLAAAIFAGDYAAAERGLQALRVPGSEVRPIGFYAMAAISAYQGRPRTGLVHLDALREAIPRMRRDALYLGFRLDYLLGEGRPEALRADLEALRAVDPAVAAEFAPALAWLGDESTALALARELREDSIRARLTAAVLAARRGEPGGLERLGELAGKTPFSVWRVAPLFLYADLAARAGRLEAAADAHRRFQALYLPRTMYRSWAYPRSLLGLARAEAGLGHAAAARQTLDRLLAAFVRAEPDHPLLAEARALRARLATSP
jgi:tetratricopeptide (TPR) repeat protein